MRYWVAAIIVIIVAVGVFLYVRSAPTSQGQNTAPGVETPGTTAAGPDASKFSSSPR